MKFDNPEIQKQYESTSLKQGKNIFQKAVDVVYTPKNMIGHAMGKLREQTREPYTGKVVDKYGTTYDEPLWKYNLRQKAQDMLFGVPEEFADPFMYAGGALLKGARALGEVLPKTGKILLAPKGIAEANKIRLAVSDLLPFLKAKPVVRDINLLSDKVLSGQPEYAANISKNNRITASYMKNKEAAKLQRTVTQKVWDAADKALSNKSLSPEQQANIIENAGKFSSVVLLPAAVYKGYKMPKESSSDRKKRIMLLDTI